VNTARQIERCGRRAAELITTGDVVLTNDPIAAPFVGMLAALNTNLPVVISDTDTAIPTLCVITVQTTACDGSILCSADTIACVAQATSRAIPIYALLAGGPDPTIPDFQSLQPSATQSILPAERINAIITDRGIYRPTMLTRHLSDGDAPMDVIPLSSSIETLKH
jgi:hypothetical protein